MGRIGIITGMPFEAKIVEYSARKNNWGEFSPVCRSGGIGGYSATAIVHSYFEQGIDSVVSFGIAGGLDPHLKSGTVVLPKLICSESGNPIRTTDMWRNEIQSVLQDDLPVATADLYSSENMISDVAAKKDLFEHTEAVAVDMESAVVGTAAKDLGMRFLAIRAIADSALHELPEAIQAANDFDEFSYRRLAGSVLKNPRQIMSLIETGLLTRKASISLKKVCQLAGANMARN